MVNKLSATERLSSRHITEWDEEDVSAFLGSMGFPQLHDQVVQDRITGDILMLFDTDTLKDFGLSIGQRLTVLKGIYQVKTAHGVELSEDDWIPPSETLGSPSADGDSSVTMADARDSLMSTYSTADLDRVNQLVRNQGERIQKLESENSRLFQMLTSLMEDFAAFRADHNANSDTSVPSISTTHVSGGASGGLDRKPSFKWGAMPQVGGKAQVSPTKSNILEISTPAASPTFPPGQAAPSTSTGSTSLKKPEPPKPSATLGSTLPPQSSGRPNLAPRNDSADNFKSFKVSLEDPTWKVLPAALKKYKINNDNWQNYAMFICYGSTGNRIERCLSYDEKPLLLFQKLKDAKKNPVFMLKHIKDIRSPIVVAQQKHAARKANSIASNDGNVGQTLTPGGGTKPLRHRPPRLEVHDLSTAPPGPETSLPSALPGMGMVPSTALMTGAVGGGGGLAAGWPHHELTSPSSEMPPSNPITSSHLSPHPAPPQSSSFSGSGSGREMPPLLGNTQVSYAVAIYPYMAEQDDEFDVVVGDTFVILSRARGWWVVQRDSDGSGKVIEAPIPPAGGDGSEVIQGWVPAGCLLETNVPVATAIAEAEAASGGKSKGSSSANGNGGNEMPDTPRDVTGFDDVALGENGSSFSGSSTKGKTPILPLSIVSTSFPGVALMEYRRKGDEELDLEKDDKLRVFKRYNHWSYAVKEDGGDRGWVPSWFIGKVSNPSAPKEGSTSVNLTPEETAAQVSPLSSAFPLGNGKV